MFAMTTRFTMPEGTDWELVRAQAVLRAFEMFRTVPGLRSKAFIFAPDRNEYAYIEGGDLVWPPEYTPASLPQPSAPTESASL